ncbi:MAG: hypothetical protein ACI9S8_000781 [Chlamydiales bacterium]|jgi:hypothetical protein
MSMPIEKVEMDSSRFDQMDKMVEGYVPSSAARKRAARIETERAQRGRLRSTQQKGSDTSSSQKVEASKTLRPALPPVQAGTDIHQDARGTMSSVLQIAHFEESETVKSEELLQMQGQSTLNSFELQRSNTISLVQLGSEEISNVRSQLYVTQTNIRVERSLQIVSTVTKTDTQDMGVHKASLFKMARILAFLAAAVERLDLLFRLYDEGSPLKDWMREMGIPEELDKPIRNVLAGVLLGLNSSGFEDTEFTGIVPEEEFDNILGQTDPKLCQNLSPTKFSETVVDAIKDILAYMTDEMEETTEMIKLLEFILLLVILMLLLLMEKLFAMGQVIGSLNKGENMDSEFLEEFPQFEEASSMIKMAFEVIGNIFESMNEDEKETLIQKTGEESPEDDLENATVDALKSMIRGMLSEEDSSKEEFTSLFTGVSKSVHQVFEYEAQAITLTIKSTA